MVFPHHVPAQKCARNFFLNANNIIKQEKEIKKYKLNIFLKRNCYIFYHTWPYDVSFIGTLLAENGEIFIKIIPKRGLFHEK